MLGFPIFHQFFWECKNSFFLITFTILSSLWFFTCVLKLFEETLSCYYLDGRNPFTTAYQSFMINLNGNDMDLEEVFQETATNLLYRLLKERKSGNIYIVYD